jgi:hypothetical protein
MNSVLRLEMIFEFIIADVEVYNSITWKLMFTGSRSFIFEKDANMQ